ncbi:NADPH:quinone reductase [Longivirga aurantiaca]|uniref:NADPH:quinone reductase n=1 Tax=Longivirga aurantiaca TaxID=1837743 RepID=A0ABW1T497_9ACTN
MPDGTMLAALYRGTGPAAEVLEVVEVARPDPGPGEVRVRVAVSGINPTDVKNRAGIMTWPIDGFQVPHHDGAGTIDAVGPGVDPGRIGEQVWLMMSAHGNAWGTAAQWCVVPEWKARRLPPDTDPLLGATLGVPAVTAAYALTADGSVEGRDVLVHGGAGAVGRCGIELGRWAGARVITTVSSEAKAEVARTAGADLVVDYRTEDVVAAVRGFSAGVHRVVEVSLAANAAIDTEVCAQDAVVVVFATDGGEAVLPVRPSLLKSLSFRFILLYNLDREALELASGVVERALDDRALTLPPITRFALEDIAAAHQLQESGPFGRVLLDIP